MTQNEKDVWIQIKDEHRLQIERLRSLYPALKQLQQELIDSRGGPRWEVETPIVYNSALENPAFPQAIRLLIVADNPGRVEQEAQYQGALVGPSGKIAEGFFRAHPELALDFRRDALILTKSPIHTPRTQELGQLLKNGEAPMAELFRQSQEEMARFLFQLHRFLSTARGEALPVWVIGYSEVHPKGLFSQWREAVLRYYADSPTLRDQIFLYRHFSMNQFAIDFNARRESGESCTQTLSRVGRLYRQRCFPEWDAGG